MNQRNTFLEAIEIFRQKSKHYYDFFRDFAFEKETVRFLCSVKADGRKMICLFELDSLDNVSVFLRIGYVSDNFKAEQTVSEIRQQIAKICFDDSLCSLFVSDNKILTVSSWFNIRGRNITPEDLSTSIMQYAEFSSLLLCKYASKKMARLLEETQPL